MNLTTAQMALLKTHAEANTNLATLPDLTTFTINASTAPRDPTYQQSIAAWYNAAAKAIDNQPFANRFVWNPVTTIQQINAANLWQNDPAGTTDAERTNNWLRWQTMIWSLGSVGNIPTGLDFGDPQVRKGVLKTWGDVASPSCAASLGGTGCGQMVGKRIELVVSDAITGTAVNAWSSAHPVQLGSDGLTLYGKVLTQIDLDKALFPNG